MALSLAQHPMDAPSVPTPTRKGTLPGQPLASPGQHPFPPQNQQQHHQQQFQWPHPNGAPPPGPYYYPNFPQQQQFGQQAFFPGQTPDQQQQQFAQWAFQQMMFTQQQQQQQQHAGVPDFAARQRTGSGAGQEYGGGFPPGAMMPPHIGGFQPSGTPPPHPHPHAGGHALHPMQYSSIGRAAGNDHQGFHPYRRPGPGGQQPPQRSASTGPSEFGGQQQQFNGQYGTVPFGPGGYPAGYPQPQRPYAREMNGSNTSLHSNGSGSGRQRTGSNAGSARTNGSNTGSVGQRGPMPHQHSHGHGHGHGPGPAHAHARNQSGGSSIATTRPASDRSVTPPARATTASPVSAASASGLSPTSATGPSAASGGAGSTVRPAKPSPLSQQTFATHDPSKRLSRDDSMLEAPNAGMPKSNGLKGRLRRALSFSAVSTLEEAEENKEKLGSRRKAIEKANKANAALQAQQGGGEASTSTPAGPESIRTTTSKKPSRTASLFNRRLNASTDNISLQSTVSSASVMIRKLGSMGKLARRNSLAGITGLFKDKDKDKSKDGVEVKKGKKADMAEASVTHATVEVERGSSSSAGGGSGGGGDEGLTPAAKLARQHTLKSNAQAAERARQQQAVAEAQAQQQAAHAAAWDRQKNRVEEEDEDEEEEESDDGTYEHPTQMTGGFDDEDVTVRLERATIQDEPWAVGIRRSVERTRQPVKGILRNAINFDQEKYLDKENAPARQRASSYTNPIQTSAEPGPLARIPSPDPDHIDGLHRSSSPHEPVATSFSAEFGDFTTPSLTLTEKPDSSGTKFNYNHPVLNSSAPVLSSIGNAPVAQRSTTAPGKSRRLTFATNLSVYDTFPPSTYDRRSEAATCNRLTPALAQRIKEELNSYKMEEMEVHASSRAHTHFFV